MNRILAIIRPADIELTATEFLPDTRTMLERNIEQFQNIRQAHVTLAERLATEIAGLEDHRRQALATVAMCDAALATQS